MDEIVAVARKHDVAIVEDNAHGLLGAVSGEGVGYLRCAGHAELSRDQELHVRGRGRATHQRARLYRPRRNTPGERHEPEPCSFAVRSTSIPGLTWAPATSSRMSWPRFCTGSSSSGSEFSRGDARSGNTTNSTWQTGPPTPRCVFLSCRRTASRRTTCSICYCRHLAVRDALIEHLRGQGILAVFHYQPLHLSAMGQRFGGKAGDCPVAEDASDRLLRLPFYNDLSPGDQSRVVNAIRGFTHE